MADNKNVGDGAGINPFDQALFGYVVRVVHSESGHEQVMNIGMVAPADAKERQVRRSLIDMGLRKGWFFRSIVYVKPPPDDILLFGNNQ